MPHIQQSYGSSRSLAEEEGLEENDKTIVATAALFHDAGFLLGTDNHEERFM